MHRMCAFALIAFASAALSQQPAQAPVPAADVPKKQSSHPQRQPEHQHRGTKDAPLFVQGVVATERTERQTRWEAEQGDQKAAVDERMASSGEATATIAIVAAGIAILQAVLFLWQLSYMRTNLADAKTAADAAKLTADITQMQMRAFVMVTGVQCEQGPSGAKYSVWMQNFGHLPVQEARFWAGRTSGPPEEEETRPRTQGDSNIVNGGPLAPGFAHAIHCTFGPLDDAGELHDRRHSLYVYGSISYEDGFGKTRTTTFHFKRSGGQGWTRSGELERCQHGNRIT